MHINYYIKIIVFLLIYCIATTSLKVYSQNKKLNISRVPVMHNFNTMDYDGGIQNWSIDQDNRDFIYVANNFGLLEFDGSEWKKYEIPLSTRSLSVKVSNNRIYVAGPNHIGYFSNSQSKGLRYTSLENLLENQLLTDEIWKIIEFGNKIVFGGLNNTYVYDGQKIYVKNIEGNNIYPCGDSLLIYSERKGLLSMDSNLNISNFKGIPNTGLITSILPITDNRLLIFMAEGETYEYVDGNLKHWASAVTDFLSRSKITTAIRTKSGKIIIGTQNNGLLILSEAGAAISHLSSKKGLNSNTVLSLYEDQFENIWVGLNNGLTCIEQGSPFSLINEAVGLTGTGYTAEYFNNRLYLGTVTGLYFQNLKGDNITGSNQFFEIVPGTEGNVYSIQNIDNKLLMGHHNGAFEIAENGVRNIYDESGTWSFIKTPHNNEILAGTYKGFIKLSGNADFIHKFKGFDESSRVFEFMNDSILWLTHGYKGTYQIQFNKSYDTITNSKFFGDKSGFPSNLLINVFKLDNKLYFPAEYGIYTFDPIQNMFVNQSEMEDLLGSFSHVSNLTMDANKNIYYIVENKAVGVLKYLSFNKYKKVESHFSKINKYISDDLENISIIDEENILIGAKGGFIHYNPEINVNQDIDFQTYIRSVNLISNGDSTIFEGGIIPDTRFQYSSGQHSFRFTFAAPYFDGFEDITYQYRLVNFDEKWSEWSMQAVKEYTNLSPGRYTFRVRAKNIYDTVSKEAVFNIYIKPRWYQTSTAWFIYFSSFFTLFFVSLFLLTRKHKTERKRLEIAKKREIQKKDRELKDVSTKSHETITKLKHEKLRAEVDHKNRELASSTMHLLNKNEIMLSIKQKLQKYAVDSTDMSGKREISRIIKTIDNNIADDENWDQFTRHFDQVHGDFLEKLKDQYPDLTPQETKLAAYLRMNLTTKNIAQLFNISVRGVEISRYRLRKKLNLDRNTNLASFIMNL